MRAIAETELRCPDCGWTPVAGEVCDGCLADLGEHRWGEHRWDEHPVGEIARVGRRASEMLVVLRTQFLEAIGIAVETSR